MDRIRKLLHDELDVMLERDGGPNLSDEIKLSLHQYNVASGVEHVSIISPAHRAITHHAIVARFVKKTLTSPRPGP
jgi:hypothetical protein